MKKFALSLPLILFVFCLACFHSTSSVVTPLEKVVIEYATFENHPVELAFDPNDGRVELRIRYSRDDNSMYLNDAGLEFLKNEVFRLTSTTQPVRLGASGYTFQFLGGHPIWAPYLGMYLDYHYRCLFFAEGGSITNKSILSHGTKKAEGFNGYALWKPRTPDN